jgi:diguanylate cyclase (GGDEF)-like protein/PAS domain S-box-containing protein
MMHIPQNANPLCFMVFCRQCGLKGGEARRVLRLVLVALFSVLSATVPVSASPSEALRLGAELPYGVYLDPSGNQGFNEIRQLPASAFLPFGNGLSLSYTTAAAWLRFELPAAPKPLAVWWLEIQPSMLDQIDLFQQGADGQIRHERAGDHLPYSARQWPYRHFLFELSSSSEATQTVYLRIRTSGSLYVLATLWDPHVFVSKIERSGLEWGMYFGGMGSLLAFALIILTVRRTSAYVALACTLSVNTIHVANSQGFLATAPLLYGPWGGDFLVAITASLSIASLIWALREFVLAPSPFRLLDRSYLGLAIVCALIPLSYGLGLYGIFMRIGLWVLLCSTLGALLILWWQRATGSRFDRVVFVSILVLFAGMTVAIFPLLGLVSSSETLLMLRSALFLLFGLIMTSALLMQIRGTYLSLLAEKSKALAAAALHEEMLEKRVSERTQALTDANRALAREEQRYRMLTESMKDVVWCMDAKTLRFVYISPSVYALCGYTPEEIMTVGMDAAFSPFAADAVRRSLAEGLNALEQEELSDRYFIASDVPQTTKEGSVVWTEVITHFYRNPDNGRVEIHGVTRDISERRAAEEKTRFLAYYDPLTALPNRRLLEQGLQAALDKAQCGEKGALFLLDLDNFKPLNDTYGHAVGDALLIDVAKRLKAILTERDMAARLGGDEFVVILTGLGHEKKQAHTHAETQAEAVRTALSEPYRLPLEENSAHVVHRCSCSIGAVLLEAKIASVSQALKQADSAMYRAKLAGRNGVCFFGEDAFF